MFKTNLLILTIICLFYSVVNGKDDTEWLNEAIKSSIKSGSPLVLGKGKIYYIKGDIKKVLLRENQMLNINGNGSTIVYSVDPNRQISSPIDVESKLTKNTTLTIKNLTFDGSPNPIQFSEKVYSNLRLAVGISSVGVTKVSLSSVKFKNIYGAGIRCLIFREFAASNVNFNRVGGKWPHGDGYDSFGDAIYLGYALDGASAEIKNCSIMGYSDYPNFGGFYKNLSRAGIVAEYNKKSHLKLSVTGTKIEGYQRAIHIEGSNTSLNLTSCTFDRYICGVFVFGYEAKDVYVSRCKFLKTYEGGKFGGAKGVITGYANNNQAFLKGCYVESTTFYRENEMKSTYDRCTISFDNFTAPSRSSTFKNCILRTSNKLNATFGRVISSK